MKEVKTPKKPFIYYLIIAATIMILLNTEASGKGSRLQCFYADDK